MLKKNEWNKMSFMKVVCLEERCVDMNRIKQTQVKNDMKEIEEKKWVGSFG